MRPHVLDPRLGEAEVLPSLLLTARPARLLLLKPDERLAGWVGGVAVKPVVLARPMTPGDGTTMWLAMNASGSCGRERSSKRASTAAFRCCMTAWRARYSLKSRLRWSALRYASSNCLRVGGKQVEFRGDGDQHTVRLGLV